MIKGKLLRGVPVSKFALPSFEGTGGASREACPAGRGGARRTARTAADVEREAYIRGFEAGEEAGAGKVAAEAAPLLAGLRNAVEALNERMGRIAREAEPQVVELAVAIARRIVVEELSLRPELIAGIVKEAIRRIERTGPVTVRVHPDLHGLIVDLQAELSESQAGILLDVDPSVPPAGPIVMGTMEEVLTDVDDQIRVIVEEMRSERAAH